VPLSPLPHQGGWRKLKFVLWFLQNSVTLVRELSRADAVHALVPGDIGTAGMALALALRKPLLVRHCGNWRVPSTLTERFVKRFIETNAGGRNIMFATGGGPSPPSGKNSAVRWIFSTSLSEEELKRNAVRREPPASGRARLAIVCRQEEAKGTGVVIESLPLLLQEFPEATLDVVGDGSALGAFQQQAERLRVSERVVFHGKVDHATVIRLLQQADVFCYPTTSSEGFPKAVLEALSCGLPVITTPVSVLPSLIGDTCGLLIDEATPAALAAAIRALLCDPVRYRALSNQALQRASEYSLEKWRDSLGEVLRTIWGPLKSQHARSFTPENTTRIVFGATRQ
jgi:hypothetical protein